MSDTCKSRGVTTSLSFCLSFCVSQLHTDMDRGDGRTKYMLEGEGVGSVFVIDGNTGNIHVTKALDREEKDQYRLVATATDRQTGRALEPSSQFIIRVQDINDNPPVFPDEPYVATVPEMANIGQNQPMVNLHLQCSVGRTAVRCSACWRFSIVVSFSVLNCAVE